MANYDVIIVGARCAGSPAAMLLARKGYKVLVVDKERFGSDTLSTHLVHPPAIAALKRWGVLDKLVATGCPPIDTYSFDFGFFKISGSPRRIDGVDVAYGPRRTILDKLLVDAAAEAGAEMRDGFTVDEVLVEDGAVAGIRGHGKDGKSVTERARVVIGADGRNSLVAKAVGAEAYNEKPALQSGYYTYWSGVEADHFEIFIRPDRGGALIPTHDGLTLCVLGWPISEFAANKTDIEGNYMRTLELAPHIHERISAGKREAFFRGGSVPNYFRKPFGKGWALIGDAGYNKDPITAMGIRDAFNEVELCVTALDEWFLGARSYDVAMGEYQSKRDADVGAMYELTTQLATMAPPPVEMQQLLGAVARDQEASDAWVSMMAATLPVPDFFAPEHVGRIMATEGANA